MTYTNSQIQQLWVNANGDPNVAPTMAAIALAESGGDASKTNTAATEGPGGSWGLWQIDVTYHPQFNSTELLDANYNAQAAVSVYNSQGFTAWSAYKNGSFARYMNAAPVSGIGASTSLLARVTQSSDNPLVLLQNWIASPSVDVLYKAFALVFVLMVLAAIPQTSKWSMWASLCVLLLLLIKENNNPSPSSGA